MTKPLLILITGAPASGKTTLAEQLAAELRLPLVSRDAFKEALMDQLVSATRTESRRLGGASFALLPNIAGLLIDASVSAIVESNFSAGFSEPEWRPFLNRAEVAQLFCHAPDDDLRRRFRARVASGRRHPGHYDDSAESLADLDAALASGRFRPLELPIPTLDIDTTDGYAPAISKILEFIATQRDPMKPDGTIHATNT